MRHLLLILLLTSVRVHAAVSCQQYGPWSVKVIGTPAAPSGTATAALQTAGNSTLSNILTQLQMNGTGGGSTVYQGGAWNIGITNFPATQPISAVALPLPTGACTSANQTTELASLASIDGKIPSGLAVSGGRLQVDAGAVTVSGSVSVSNFPGTQNVNVTGGTLSVTNSANGTPGSSPPSEAAQIAGSDGSLLRVLKVSTGGVASVEIMNASPIPVSITGTAGTSATNITQVLGAAPSATNPLAVRQTDGTTFYDARQIRALTSADQMTIAGTASVSIAGGTLAVNQTQMNGVAMSSGNGVAGTGVQRVAIASDNTAFSVNSVQSGTWNVNVAGTGATNSVQIAGNAISTGNGVAGTGVQRVAIASDNTAFTVNSAQSGSWSMNISGTAAINHVQINGVTLASGNGVAGTGVQRVAIASDNSAVSVAIASSSTTLNVKGANNIDTVDSSGPVKVGGQFNTTLPTMTTNLAVNNLQQDINGRLITTNSGKNTYRASSAVGFSIAATGTDFFTITGSATRTVQVTEVGMRCTQTTAADNDVLFVKRSTANTGGTSTTRTAVPMDSANAAATAVVRTYTANPTTGTLVGALMTERVLFSTPNGGASSQMNLSSWKFGREDEQAIFLRGTSEVFALSFNSQTATGNVCNLWIEWTEL